MELDAARVAALLADLDSADKPVIRQTVDELIPLAADFPAVRALLERRLAEAGHRNRWPAAYVLAHLPEPSVETIQALLDALDHPEPDIRWANSLLLARIGRDNADLKTELINLCSSGSSNQKRMALYCLRDLALTDTASAAAMIGALKDGESTVRVAAVICLKTRHGLDATGKETLLQVYLNDRDSRALNAAAIALATLGKPAPQFIVALENNSRTGDEQTKKAADAALELLKKEGPPQAAENSR